MYMMATQLSGQKQMHIKHTCKYFSTDQVTMYEAIEKKNYESKCMHAGQDRNVFAVILAVTSLTHTLFYTLNKTQIEQNCIPPFIFQIIVEFDIHAYLKLSTLRLSYHVITVDAL